MDRRQATDWLRFSTACCVAVLLCACTSSIGSSDISRARYSEVPGEDYKLLMPPKGLQDKIAGLMATGDTPAYLSLPQASISAICGPNLSHVLGCVVETRVGKTIFISRGVSGEARRMLLMHEFAHYLYGWHHS